MEKKSVKYALFIAISTAIILAVTFVLDGYINKEGFNPSDDGVVIAQSYRIINGEIPHKDFISIRPVFSGIMHSIHFFSPFPLVVSGRIFTLIEYYAYSVIWVYLLMIMFMKGTRKEYFHVFLPLIFVSFFLNLNTYHLYPWTTIDGILFSILGFFFYFKGKSKNKYLWKSILFSIALFSVSLGSLSKQSFIFPAALLYVLIILDLFREKKYGLIPLIILAGATPYLAYLAFLFANNIIPEFVRQMSGRTEFFKTAVIRYAISFLRSKILILHILTLAIVIFDIYSVKNKFSLHTGLKKLITFNNNKFTIAVISTYLSALIFLSFRFILHNDYHSLPFEFLWIFLIILLLSYYKNVLSKDQVLLCITGIIIAWSASISLGANSPVYTSGIMVSASIMLIYNYFKHAGIFPLHSKLRFIVYVSILVMMHGFYFAAIYGQTKYNYRELASKHLKMELKDMFPEFGNIVTNHNTYNYYNDFVDVYNEFDLQNRFVLLPNNAIIYPLLKSRNPFPLDWMQGAEFIGSEEKLNNMVLNVLETKDVYLIIDKFDSKEMAYGFKTMNYDTIDYPYMKLIKEKCIKIDHDSEYFDIYRTVRSGSTIWK